MDGDDLTFEEWCAEMEAMDHQEYLEVMAELEGDAVDPSS